MSEQEPRSVLIERIQNQAGWIRIYRERAENAESELAEATEECRYRMGERDGYRDEARRMKARAERAEAEAARWKSAAVYAKDSIIAEYTGACERGSAYEDAIPVIYEALQSAPPASESFEDERCRNCGGHGKTKFPDALESITCARCGGSGKDTTRATTGEREQVIDRAATAMNDNVTTGYSDARIMAERLYEAGLLKGSDPAPADRTEPSEGGTHD